MTRPSYSPQPKCCWVELGLFHVLLWYVSLVSVTCLFYSNRHNFIHTLIWRRSKIVNMKETEGKERRKEWEHLRIISSAQNDSKLLENLSKNVEFGVLRVHKIKKYLPAELTYASQSFVNNMTRKCYMVWLTSTKLTFLTRHCDSCLLSSYVEELKYWVLKLNVCVLSVEVLHMVNGGILWVSNAGLHFIGLGTWAVALSLSGTS